MTKDNKNKQNNTNGAAAVPESSGLRSDQLDLGQKKPASLVWWIAGGIMAAVLIITTVVLVYALPSRKVSIDNSSNTGSLPLASETVLPSGSQSSLSGRTCDNANRRPIGVMLSSDMITRPVSGFADADMVWELPVLVNDVTRLLAVYQCGRPAEIGSVRSARHDYLFLAEGIDAIVGHWGGSYHALNRIAAGEFQTINALTNPFSAYFRKDTLPAPYNGFTTYDNLWNALQKLGYRTTTNFTGYQFKDDVPTGDRPAGGQLSIAWPGAFRVSYEYDPNTNRYQRYWAGVKQIDGDTKAAVAPSAVVIMRATNGSATGPGGYNDVGIEGTGELTVYQDGQIIKGTWRKNELDKKDPVHFLDEKGQPITFTRGQLWVMAVEPEIAVTWQPTVPSPSPVMTASPVSTVP